MTKMSEAQRAAILAGYSQGPRGVIGTRNYRTRLAMQAAGWVDEQARCTREGLLAAGVDMDAIRAEALRETAAPAAPTLADDVAALRSLIETEMGDFAAARGAGLAILDRIATRAPQPTRVWMHRCGVVLINDTQPPSCHVCVSTPDIPFVRLYTLGEVR